MVGVANEKEQRPEDRRSGVKFIRAAHCIMQLLMNVEDQRGMMAVIQLEFYL